MTVIVTAGQSLPTSWIIQKGLTRTGTEHNSIYEFTRQVALKLDDTSLPKIYYKGKNK